MTDDEKPPSLVNNGGSAADETTSCWQRRRNKIIAASTLLIAIIIAIVLAVVFTITNNNNNNNTENNDPTFTSDTSAGSDEDADVLDGLDDATFGELFDDGNSNNNATTSFLWKSDLIKPNNGGLHLTIQNALDDTWQDEFQVVTSDWNKSPALTLQTQRVNVDDMLVFYDTTCEQRVDGIMKVCNANFGPTGWVGINENVIMRDERILSSVVKLNDYYLRNANYDQKRFTLCHEIGRGKFSCISLVCVVCVGMCKIAHVYI